MADREKVISTFEKIISICKEDGCDFVDLTFEDAEQILALLKEQDELLRKLQKDKDKLCLEVSEWKHKFHDAPPKFVSQGVVDQIRWERDTALSQLEQIGKGLGSKMDDIVALLKEQDAVKPKKVKGFNPPIYLHLSFICENCKTDLITNQPYCSGCGRPVKWE